MMKSVLITVGATIITVALSGVTYLGRLSVEPWPYQVLHTVIDPVQSQDSVTVLVQTVRNKRCPYILEYRVYSGPNKVADFRKEFSTPRKYNEEFVVKRSLNIDKPKWREGRDEWRVGAMCNWWQSFRPNYNPWRITHFSFKGLPIYKQ